MAKHPTYNHPFDTPLASGLRFLAEIIAWVAGPWAAAQLSAWLIFPTIVILISLPSVFSTPGDKSQIVVPTPGPVRVLLELLLHLVAVAGAWLVWPVWVACCATLILLAAILVGIPRTKWLLGGAPAPLGEAP